MIINKMPLNVVGILDCKNKTIYGINKKSNTPLVLFKPHDNTIGNILVPSKLKYTNKNHYCVVRIVRRDTQYRFPIGSIVYTLGQVEDEKAHCEFLLHCHNLNFKDPQLQISKTKFKKIRKKTNIWDIIDKNKLKSYKDYRFLSTISVDPSGSKDIDDAISLHNGRIGIHIADVTFWLKHFDFNPSFYSTIYTPHRKINMLPSFLADNICSLVENQDRLALTLWYDIESGLFVYENTIIRVRKNYTYDNFPLDTDIFEISQKIGKKYGIEVTDTHKMIEVFMILANNKTAEYLYNKNKHLYRIHDEKHHYMPVEDISNPQFKEFMKIYLSNSAVYSDYPDKHFGLNLDLYTHFTSPIRRMADIYVHLLIKGDNFVMDIDKCNEDMKKTKKLQKDFDKFKVVSNIKNTITTNGFVINYNEENVLVYFPEIDFCDRIPLISRKIPDDEIRQTLVNKQLSKLETFSQIQVFISKKGNDLVYSF